MAVRLARTCILSVLLALEVATLGAGMKILRDPDRINNTLQGRGQNILDLHVDLHCTPEAGQLGC